MPRIFKLLLYFVYVVILGGLAGAIYLTFHNDQVVAPSMPNNAHHVTHKVATRKVTPNKSTSSVPASRPNPLPAPDNTASSNPAPNNPTPSPQSAPPQASNTNSNPSSNPSGLTNTGPGDVFWIFIGTTLGSALFYRLYLVRRLA